jgi:hypothetical protein
MNIPSPVKIKAEHHKALMASNDKITSVNQMMQMFQTNCEARIAEHNATTRKIWEQIRAEHPELDFENIMWVPGKDNDIIPVQMRMNNGAQS